jgi:hypothetical protein
MKALSIKRLIVVRLALPANFTVHDRGRIRNRFISSAAADGSKRPAVS